MNVNEVEEKNKKDINGDEKKENATSDEKKNDSENEKNNDDDDNCDSQDIPVAWVLEAIGLCEVCCRTFPPPLEVTKSNPELAAKTNINVRASFLAPCSLALCEECNRNEAQPVKLFIDYYNRCNRANDPDSSTILVTSTSPAVSNPSSISPAKFSTSSEDKFSTSSGPEFSTSSDIKDIITESDLKAVILELLERGEKCCGGSIYKDGVYLTLEEWAKIVQ